MREIKYERQHLIFWVFSSVVNLMGKVFPSILLRNAVVIRVWANGNASGVLRS